MPLNKNRIFVTGGTGFLGSYILRELLKHGYDEIVALRRKTSRMDLVEGISDRIDWLEGDVLDIASLEDGMKKADIVIHAAAVISFDPREKSFMQKVNIEGTANLVNIALEAEVKRFVFISSTTALGRLKNGVAIDEQTEWADSPFNSAYGISKRRSELEVWRGMAEGLEVNIVNPSYILGGGYWDVGPTHLIQMIDRRMPWYSMGSNGMVDVRDVARMTRILMESNKTGQRYICSADNLSYRDLFEAMALGISKYPPHRKMTPWIAALAWRLERLGSFFTGKSPSITREMVMIASHDFQYDAHRSKTELNMKYIPMEQTIADTCACYLEAKKLSRNYGILDIK